MSGIVGKSDWSTPPGLTGGAKAAKRRQRAQRCANSVFLAQIWLFRTKVLRWFSKFSKVLRFGWSDQSKLWKSSHKLGTHFNIFGHWTYIPPQHQSFHRIEWWAIRQQKRRLLRSSQAWCFCPGYLCPNVPLPPDTYPLFPSALGTLALCSPLSRVPLSPHFSSHVLWLVVAWANVQLMCYMVAWVTWWR